MAVEYLGAGQDEGTIMGRSSTDKIGFFGITTPVVRQSVVTTVDSTTITTVDTTIASTGLTAEATLVVMLENHAKAINRLIADSRSTSKALNQKITRLRNLGLFASS